MTQQSRTTESINRDNAAIRDIMHRIREMTVPDRATLALGLVGHLATMMNRSQMAKLMGQLTEEARRVQDVPPSRQKDADARHDQSAAGSTPTSGESRGVGGGGAGREAGREGREDGGAGGLRGAGREGGSGQRTTERGVWPLDTERTPPTGDAMRAEGRGAEAPGGVGQAGRGEFRSRGLV
jgi:ATP-dependent RNA helicase DeaD